jgi:ubiquinone/menaquinone biosynthesis C-methylase UbiE
MVVDYDFLPISYYYKISPHLKGVHLDFGCGDGRLTNILSFLPNISAIIGYDICDEKVDLASQRFKSDKVSFIKSDKIEKVLEEVDSLSLNFVFHETGHTILSNIYPFLNKRSRIVILDYDMKTMSLEKFASVFVTKPELGELMSRGLESAHKIHTRSGLKECKSFGEDIGFKTIAEYKLMQKYFIWIAEKR